MRNFNFDFLKKRKKKHFKGEIWKNSTLCAGAVWLDSIQSHCWELLYNHHLPACWWMDGCVDLLVACNRFSIICRDMKRKWRFCCWSLTNCCNLPSAAKPNWLLSPSIELGPGSAFIPPIPFPLFFPAHCPLLKTSFSPSHSLLHTVPLVRGWLVNVSGFTMMAEGSKGSWILSDIPFGEWRSQGWYYSTNGSAALPLPCFSPALCWLWCRVRSKVH